jgi:predicted transposase YbfD/YdcC
MFIPLLDAIDIQGKDITADALLTQRKLADWNYDEDRSRIRTGHGPENMSRLRRFAVGILLHFADDKTSLAEKMRRLNRNIRLVFDYLRMTKNSTGHVSS